MDEKGFRTGLVSRLTGLTYKRIDYYDRHGLVRPEIRAAAGRGSRRLYSRANLIELKVLGELMKRGISLEKVRRTLAEARKLYPNADRPLLELTFRTDGRSVYVIDPSGAGPVDMLHPEQPVLGVAVEEITQQIDRAIRRFANHQIEEVRVRGASHLVEVVSDTSSHGYVVRCPELLGISVKGRTVEEALEKMKERIAEALAKLSSKDSR